MKNTTLKRVLAMAMALVLMLGAFAIPIAADEAATGTVVKLHYNRPDGNYADWSVWIWPQDQSGIDVPLVEENGEMVATYQVPAGTTAIGYIVKLPNWAEKDVAEDQFIDLAAVVSGTVHVYVESGVKGHDTRYADDVILGIKVTGARYEENKGVTVTMSSKLITDPSNVFAITDGAGAPVAITSVTEGLGNTYVLATETALDLMGSYTLTYDGNEYKILLPNVYSTEGFEEKYTYTGSDLGATWTKEKTTFRLWAPTATAVQVNLYTSGTAGTDDLIDRLDMTADVNGTWVAVKEEDLNGTYYTYQVTVNGNSIEACDPYARTTGVNGQRAMVIDLASTNPEGWDTDADPHAGKNITDAVIYELHVRDLSSDSSSGIQNVGKFLGLIETGTTNSKGVPTGLDHIKALGITHLHLLPSYDYGSVDESKLDKAQFNWGYDPVNYNVPEGSYSTDPYNGAVRVKEMKQMVKGLHDNGISVVMDVVYNHVHDANSFCFNQIVPQYFSRVDDNGSYSSGSGCGNDTASERAMVKKYIVDSVKYWADEYHIDGFRFDLVGLIDTETMNEVIAEVHKDHPNVIFYGEGWTMATKVTKPGYTMTTQYNSQDVPKFAFFSDTIRDMLKGSVFDNNAKGYVSGAQGQEALLGQCFLGMPSWCTTPSQSINYASCHDNISLYDRLTQSTPNATVEDRIRMNNLAAAIYMTSQGVPFMQAGEEMLRSKPLEDGTFDHNSYSSPDSVNSLKWDDLNNETYQAVYNYYKGLIAFRKAHGALRMTTAEDVKANITAVTCADANVAAFQIKGGVNGETGEGLFVIFNANSAETTVDLPEGNWNVYINDKTAGTTALSSHTGSVTVAPISAMVLVKEANVVSNGVSTVFVIGIVLAGMAAGAVVAYLANKMRKK